MMPVGPGLTMLESSILNCLHYGVDSIWITVDDNQLPYAKKCLGEMGYDPVRYYDPFSINKKDQRKRVSIYFVPTLTKYRDYCDNYAFGFINAGLTAKKVYGHISKYCEPDYYFFSSPFGMLNYKEIRTNRKKYKSGNRQSLFTYRGKNALSGEHLPMCVNKDTLINLKKHVLSNSTKMYKASEQLNKSGIPVELLPREERYKGKKLTMEEVYACLNKGDFDTYELDWFYNVISWQNYRQYITSNKEIKRSNVLRRDYVTYPLLDTNDE
tara:strand:- start:433 stop:1239 length:807 start_codon:yes stop_codon:yes gene_type:complete